MKGKPEYTHNKLLKKVSKEYHSVIEVFMKGDIKGLHSLCTIQRYYRLDTKTIR